ncbi:UDP-N-acetylmuramoyl-tripeptide--D-alanyl-D-alanine ligase [Aliidiomarina taiwanensis]|uniref:UDP-N-acetylmuramoyl-tripeptide--D-alanyl-D-alanine ligase n=1 Tax=Aliidiomarina taiwanensis TaxID=946228 RepID=A0A432X7R3_9GAMM|nr:UDP-N-acetylmuramoyl-tripeptide--D-alanyl-D-alanine ligase [Aliidiomarina taiwanensis]RUO42885.1 UDP-N-acetylmuramoyl-tripeptide--D-alanyl-D-alanine ligase [Aliidiomarina taiwanensis]
MIKVSLNWVNEHIQGHWQGAGEPTPEITGVSIDSRTVSPGDLFIAIKGPSFDGHNYAQQALDQGAVAVVVSRDMQLGDQQLVVPDTRYALGQLAAAVKREVAPVTIGITGSSGKTTVKEMLARILTLHLQGRGEVLATEGNFNNDIGVPLTLLRLTHAHQYAVVELGANHRGEIAYTTGLTKPDVALINNIAPAHVEGFGGIAGVARAKMEIFRELSSTGVAITPAHSDFHDLFVRELEGKQHWLFSYEGAVEKPAKQGLTVWAEHIELDPQGCAAFDLCTAKSRDRVQLAMPGLHNVSNALAAASCCLAIEIPMTSIVQGLSELQPVPGRMWVHRLENGLTVIDDSYNANVGSVRAAIDVLSTLPGHCIFVLGDMGELGTDARAYHEEVGVYAREAGVNELYTVGVLSQSANDAFSGEHGARHFDNKVSLTKALLQLVQERPALTVLVKGSRSAHMEQVVAALLANSTHTNEQAGDTVC